MVLRVHRPEMASAKLPIHNVVSNCCHGCGRSCCDLAVGDFGRTDFGDPTSF